MQTDHVPCPHTLVCIVLYFYQGMSNKLSRYACCWTHSAHQGLFWFPGVVKRVLLCAVFSTDCWTWRLLWHLIRRASTACSANRCAMKVDHVLVAATACAGCAEISVREGAASMRNLSQCELQDFILATSETCLDLCCSTLFFAGNLQTQVVIS